MWYQDGQTDNSYLVRGAWRKSTARGRKGPTVTRNRWVKVLQEARGQAGRQSDLTAIGKLSDNLNICTRLYRKDDTKAVDMT